ncbi:type III sulfide quinone reductase, selenoprotein subtype [Nostocoides vanveenii]|jgi:sulfide:quinone oxidoreductase|uniref:FAD/NAD(P)-binding oxidoreductase n=1 Tax=Nostocoides vanveenii TaxID=330835 RepID=A0ABN2K9D5_9MICO
MATLVILGAGTAGTMLANRLRRRLGPDDSITVVDRDDAHHYQPGYLFIPFGKSTPERVVRSRRGQLADGVTFVEGAVTRVDPERRAVSLADGRELAYDWLVIASGTSPRPEQTPGLADEKIWRTRAFDFYTLAGSTALRQALADFDGGRLLVHISEMPIKCPVAPLEFALLADDYFRGRRIRHKVDITYVTPLDGAFTKPVASKRLGGLLEDRSIRLATDFAIERVDPEAPALVGFDGRRLPFDLLVTVPVNMGAQFVIDSGLGDDLGFVPVDKHTLQSSAHERIFAIGDATNVPTSKAGAVAHFEAEHVVDNLVAAMAGRPLTSHYDGHANCFVESGRGKAMLLDFNYDTEPLTGVFPYPPVGPLTLLGESRRNHLGKLAFEKIYWNLLLPGHPLPVPNAMSMAGKVPAGKA